MSFLAAQNRLNASVMNHLRNCKVTIGGVEVPGIYMSPAVVASMGAGIADSRPAVQIFTSDCTANPDDSTITVDGVPYVVGAHAHGGTGFTTLTLDRTL